MGFTPFVDDLGLVVALILTGATVLAYTAIRGFMSILRNDPAQLRAVLKASAVPAGSVGLVSLLLGIWIEYTWPFLLSDGLGSYDIFFGDIIVIFGMVMVVYAIVAYYGLKLEYAGLLGFVGGVITAWYGYWGYTTLVAPGVLGLTRDPLETFLLYGAYAAAGVFSLPAALVVDWFLEHPGATFKPISISLRPASEAPAAEASGDGRFHLPYYVYVLIMWFPIFMVLAAIAAWFYIGDILPAHLTSPP